VASERPISRGRSPAPARVWIDDPNPLFRAGLACCLARGGYEVAGQSSAFVPAPPAGADVVVFDLGDTVVTWGVSDVLRVSDRLLGVAADGRLDSVLVRRRLEPDALLEAVARALEAGVPG